MLIGLPQQVSPGAWQIGRSLEAENAAMSAFAAACRVHGKAGAYPSSRRASRHDDAPRWWVERDAEEQRSDMTSPIPENMGLLPTSFEERKDVFWRYEG